MHSICGSSFLFLLAAGSLAAQTRQLSDTTRAYVVHDAPVIVLRQVRVIDGTGSPPRTNQVIVISDGRIAYVGDSTGAPAMSGARVVDLSGRTVTPGFVGLHDHMYYTAGPHRSAMSVTGPRLYLAGGVTTIRTAGANYPYNELNLKRGIDRGDVPGPHIYVAVTLSSSSSPTSNMPLVTTVADARRQVDYWVDEGVSWFGEGLPGTRELMGAVIDEAHKKGAKVAGHICSVTHREAVALGIDNLEHGLITATDYLADKKPDACPPDAMTGQIGVDVKSDAVRQTFREMIDRRVAMTSTLSVYELFVPTRPPSKAREAKVLDALAPEVAAEYRKAREEIEQRKAFVVEPELFQKMIQYDVAFFRAGGTLGAGVDPWGHGSLPGYGNQRNYEILVEGGLTPAEAIKVMTLNGATILGGADQYGSIAAGKRADLVVIDGDPTTRPTDIYNVSLVFKDGVGYDSAKLIGSVKGLVGIQ